MDYDHIENITEYVVSFRIIDKELNPSEITALMGITPDIAYKKGDQNTKMSKKGKLIEFSPFSTGVWIIDSKEGKHLTLEHHFKSLIALLYPLKATLLDFSQRGYKMDMFCGIFLFDGTGASFEIDPNTLLQLGELNISMGVCYYN